MTLNPGKRDGDGMDDHRGWDDDEAALRGMLERLRDGNELLPRSAARVMLDFLDALTAHQLGAVDLIRELRGWAETYEDWMGQDDFAKRQAVLDRADDFLRGR